jgi:hypothetical protein
MTLRRDVVLYCALAIAGVPAMARAQFRYEAPSTSAQDTVGVWNDFNGMSGTAPVSIHGIGPWQTIPWPYSAGCTRGGLYSQQPSYHIGDWQLGTFLGRGPAYQITLGPGNTTILNNRLELNSSPGPTAPLGTANGGCFFLLEPASTCSVASGCISSAYFKWSTYISSAAVITDGLGPHDWAGALFQLHPAGTISSGSWPGLSVEMDGNGNPYLVFATQCTAGTTGCIQVDPNDPSTTALNWKPFLSPGYVGRWIDFAYYIKLSPGSDGVQSLWVDGQQVITWNGPNMYSDPSGHPRLNVQHGNYRLSKATSTLPLYQTPLLYSTTNPCSPDFGVSASPSSISGTSTSSTITVTPGCGFSGMVSLSASGVPTGASATLNPTSVTVSGSTSANSTLSLSQGGASSGTYTITVTGASGAVSHSAAVSWNTVSNGGGGSALFSDTFNRTTGLGSNWSIPYGSFTTDGANALSGAMTSSGTGNWAGVVPAMGTNDYAVVANLIIPSGSLYSGVIARGSGGDFTSDLYAAQISTDGTVNLYRRNSWNWTALASAPAGIVAGTNYSLKLVATGSNPVHLEAWVNGTRYLSYDDSSASRVLSGVPGMENYDGMVRYDSFDVYAGTGPAGSPPPPPTVDGFGIKMIYPTKAGGQQWAMNMASANTDPRFNPQATITRNADGSWKIQDTSTRLLVFTSTGYDQTRILSYDPDVLDQQGYMQAANDWRNIEMTGYVRVNAASVNDSYTWYARGGRHNDVTPCEGTAYKGDLFFDGGARVAKESWHVSYDFSTQAPSPANRNQWIGFKMALYNVLEAGKLVPHVELYVNTSLDKMTWTKVYDFKDDGTWAGDMLHCGGSNALMPITWGGPIATFRWDNASDVDFEWLSVREIQVP